MSRSYKKHPWVTDGSPGSTQQSKKLANRRLRKYLKNSDELLQGSKYKRHTESYDIHDYKNRWTWEDAKAYYEHDCNKYSWFRDRYPTIEEYRKWWEKYYKRK